MFAGPRGRRRKLFGGLRDPIAEALQHILRCRRLNKTQEVLAQGPIGTIPFHRHGMHDRSIPLFRRNRRNPDTHLLLDGVRTKQNARIRLAAEDVVQDASGIRGDVQAIPQVETVRAGEPDFYRAAGIWRLVMESRGRQMVAAGHLAEAERRAALEAYTRWMQETDAAQTLHQAAIVATKRTPRRNDRRP